MEGQRALRIHQKYLNLCSKDERRSYGFGTTWGWVINDKNFILGWRNPLNRQILLCIKITVMLPSFWSQVSSPVWLFDLRWKLSFWQNSLQNSGLVNIPSWHLLFWVASLCMFKNDWQSKFWGREVSEIVDLIRHDPIPNTANFCS